MSEGENAYWSPEGQEPGRQSYLLSDHRLLSPSNNPGAASGPCLPCLPGPVSVT